MSTIAMKMDIPNPIIPISDISLYKGGDLASVIIDDARIRATTIRE